MVAMEGTPALRGWVTSLGHILGDRRLSDRKAKLVSLPRSVPDANHSVITNSPWTGYVEGQNLAVEHRWAEGRYDRLPALAADLVNRVAAIVTLGGPPPALAAKAATSSIPIVFHMGADPVELGIVASLSRPGGNITGATMLAVTLEAKRLALVREMAPTRRMRF
jgi:hypothetical protein